MVTSPLLFLSGLTHFPLRRLYLEWWVSFYIWGRFLSPKDHPLYQRVCVQRGLALWRGCTEPPKLTQSTAWTKVRKHGVSWTNCQGWVFGIGIDSLGFVVCVTASPLQGEACQHWELKSFLHPLACHSSALPWAFSPDSPILKVLDTPSLSRVPVTARFSGPPSHKHQKPNLMVPALN